MGYSLVNVHELEPGGRTGAVRFVRRELGVEAFGLNWFELPPGHRGPRARRDRHRAGGGQRRRPRRRASGGSTARRSRYGEGTFLRFDPETVRCPVAGPDGMTFLAIGARRGAYEARGPF